MSRTVVSFQRTTGAPAEMSDEALLAACATGDGAALGALFDRHHDGVRRFLGRLSGTDDRDLDDLVQATFEILPRAARRFDGRAPVRTWLFGTAANVARHHVRSEIRRKRVVAAAAELPRRDGDTTADVVARERAVRLADAIAALPVKLRETFVLVYLEGVSGKEAAAILDCREGAIWKRLHEARARLRDALEGALT
ncbi:MAG TPA: RNA polymerase sigma factor [Kofleriaceae bacterium]|nr:RNA polymerase sigma factor [Kofleriaceae bacterium]